MLFLGTEKYPDENEYSNYLNTNGGFSNAFTSAENTNYYFDVTHQYLEGALDRFAQFFIGPLFTQDSTDREMNAIDSGRLFYRTHSFLEHSKNIQRDSWRGYQLSRTVSNPKHPYSKFGTGNLETLKKHDNIRDLLLEFHKKYYSANIMKLVVLGRGTFIFQPVYHLLEPLETLQSWVTEKFSAVVNKNVEVPRFTETKPFPPEFTGRKLEVVPVKDLRFGGF